VNGAVITRRTWLIFGGLIAAIVAVAVAMGTGVLGEVPTLWVSDIGSTAINAVAAAIVLWTALSFGRGERVGRPWILVGLGVAAYALGDLAWSYIELVQGLNPWPSVADIFYSAEYVFMFAGILLAALAYRQLSDWRRPLVISTVSGLGLAAVLYVTVLGPRVLSDTGMTVLERVVSAGYPLADAILFIAPALFIALFLVRLGAGRLAWGWWAVLAGTVLLAVSDTVYSVMTALGTYGSGVIIDNGWMVAHALIALGALIARDVSRA
jgi:hypothetical protein